MAEVARTASALRFLLVGGTTVLIDAAVYAGLEAVGVHYDLAKTVGFVTGAVFAYFANWRFTFGGRRHRFSELLFVVVYLCALGINILLNALIRSIAPDSTPVAVIAFLAATGVSAVWNFAGMSLLVFRRPGTTVAASERSRASNAGRTSAPIGAAPSKQH